MRLVAVALILAGAAAHADDGDAYWAGQQGYLDKHLESASAACDAKFTFEWIDKPTLRSETEKVKRTPFGVCVSIVDAVRTLCGEGNTEKAAVKKEIAGFRCGFGKPRKLSLDATVLTYLGNGVEPNFDKFAHPWLLGHL